MALHANVNRDPKREAFKATDFLPSPQAAEPSEKDGKQEAEQVKALFVGMFGDRVKRK